MLHYMGVSLQKRANTYPDETQRPLIYQLVDYNYMTTKPHSQIFLLNLDSFYEVKSVVKTKI